jgi:hypothetical protein
LEADTTLTTGTTLTLGMLAKAGFPPFNLDANGHSLTLATTGPLAEGNAIVNGNISDANSITVLEDTTFSAPTKLTFDTFTLGSPTIEAEIYGPGGIVFDNSGEVNLIYGSLEPDIKSINFLNPGDAFLPGLSEVPVVDLIDELLDAEGSDLRSVFDLAKQAPKHHVSVHAPKPVDWLGVPGAHLLRSSEVYNELGMSP